MSIKRTRVLLAMAVEEGIELRTMTFSDFVKFARAHGEK